MPGLPNRAQPGIDSDLPIPVAFDAWAREESRGMEAPASPMRLAWTVQRPSWSASRVS